MDEGSKESSWLIIREPIIRNVFILILALGFVGGLLRFLFPFQILNLGGTETIIALGSSLSSIGQVIGLILLSRLFSSQRVGLIVSGVLFTFFILATGFSTTAELLLYSRIVEGAGAGLLAIIIIRISSGFEECRGESVGTLLAGVFLGSALGQGSAGIVIGQLEVMYSMTQTEAIMFLGVVVSVVFVLLLILLIPFIREIDTICVSTSDRNHGHSHTRLLLRSLRSKNLVILLAIYILYDFSHGIYTPGLSIMINNNGIPIDQIGLGFLVGDAVWGASQLYTGKLVDRTGSLAPLALSLVAKGSIVIFYPYAASFMILTSLLAMAGLSEGFLEPARNDAAMEFTPTTTTDHNHKHYFLGHAPGNPFSISSHDHEHIHETGSDEIVSILQTLGILGFAVGSSGGGWLLTQGLTLIDLVFIGGVFLIIAGILSGGLRQSRD
ncbi:MAG: MFS transporter [Candidatus Thorarchaeota archaeon]|nr:MAG: MFS transporter [Candidatus Thorarchaeota archaeon]